MVPEMERRYPREFCGWITVASIDIGHDHSLQHSYCSSTPSFGTRNRWKNCFSGAIIPGLMIASFQLAINDDIARRRK